VKPTATHSDALTHDTDDSSLVMVPALGLGTTDHTDPFHTIANVLRKEPVSVFPTATQLETLTHDTDNN
jgi:hypothetical protein